MKKILFSLGTLVVVGAAVAGGTLAFYNDTETSTGNIFVAGSVDLKVDHTRQVYNGVDCKTCDVTLISDPTNIVVAKNGLPIGPYPAQYLSWIHPAWTAQNDPTLSSAGAKWIWEQNPVKQEDTTTTVEYTFRKEFEWWGPISGSDLWFAVGSDNSVEVWLNNVKVGENTGEYGYKQESMLHIPGATITSNIVQGNNVLEFKVKNWILQDGNPQNNPAGLIYKFYIDGNCDGDYFKTQCKLWGLKDLGANDRFFNFDDIKPADWGINVISLHVNNNDSYACLLVHDLDDEENNITDSETDVGDNPTSGNPSGYGELSNYIDVFAWTDLDGDGVYEPVGETSLYEGPIDTELVQLSLVGNQTSYVGLAWCAGTISVDHTSGGISCNGAGMLNDAQTDSLSASLTAYAVQQRNNQEFSCSSLEQQFPRRVQFSD